MKISKGSITITEAPGIDRIVIEQTPTGEVITQVTFDGDEWMYSLKSLMEARDALTAAVREAREMAGLPSEGSALGPWVSLRDVPENVPQVRDKDDATYNRPTYGWASCDSSDDRDAPFRLPA